MTALREDAADVIAVMLNGGPRTLPRGSSAEDLVVALGWQGRPVAVEVNEQVVPRARLAACMLEPGDRVEIVTLVGGG